jgi:hypothetical protein
VSARRQHQITDDPLMVGSELISPPSRLSWILVFTSLQIRRYGRTSRGLCPAVSRFFNRSAVSVGPSVDWWSSCRWYCHNVTMAKHVCRTGCSLCLHAAARLVYGSRKFDHVTLLLRDLHWLRAPSYLADELHRVIGSRQRLHSAPTAALAVPATVHCPIDDRAFPVATDKTWNGL